MLKKITFAIAMTLVAGLAFGADIDRLIPAAGTGPGANGSSWQSEITIHNVSIKPISLEMTFHGGLGAMASRTLDINPTSTISLNDVVRNEFGVDAGTGAIAFDIEDKLVDKLVITSLTFNRSIGGEFGQDIPALDQGSALRKDDIGVITGPSFAQGSRFNFGIFASEETVVDWRLIRADGTVAASVERSYDAGVQVQYNVGVASLFNADPMDNDVVHALVLDGQAWVYGSLVNELTGDPSYVPGIGTRANLAPVFIGLDLNEDGIVDLFDEDNDGELDTIIDLATATFPAYFRIVAEDPEDDAVSYTIISESDALLIDDIGTIFWKPSSAFHGQTGVLVLRATDGTEFSDFRIVVRYN